MRWDGERRSNGIEQSYRCNASLRLAIGSRDTVGSVELACPFIYHAKCGETLSFGEVSRPLVRPIRPLGYFGCSLTVDVRKEAVVLCYRTAPSAPPNMCWRVALVACPPVNVRW